MMNRGVGAYLQKLRVTRNLSLCELASRASVAKSTLSKWESGRFQPRLPELAAVLDALQATPAQRREALARIDAPRARLERQPAWRQDALAAKIPPPCGGDLLRAIRLRQGLTLEEVARAVRVRHATVSRWEHSESWPDPERLCALCHLLQACPDESAALQQGRFWLLPEEGTGAPSATEITHQMELMRVPPADGSETMPRDLPFLALEAQVWRMAGRQSSAQALLAELYGLHADYLAAQGRTAEARQYADRSLTLQKETVDG